jgi:hypothetical protein
LVHLQGSAFGSDYAAILDKVSSFALPVQIINSVCKHSYTLSVVLWIVLFKNLVFVEEYSFLQYRTL